MSNSIEATAITCDSQLFNNIKEAVIKAFKPLVNAESVSNGSVAASWFDTDEAITASVIFKAPIEAVEGFAPTYAEGICHIDFGLIDNDGQDEWDGQPVTLNYGMYSYNMTWATKNAGGTFYHDNGESFCMESSVDDDLSEWVMGAVLGEADHSDTDYQAFLKAVFAIARKDTDTP